MKILAFSCAAASKVMTLSPAGSGEMTDSTDSVAGLTGSVTAAGSITFVSSSVNLMTSRVVSELVTGVSEAFVSLQPANAPSIRPVLNMTANSLVFFIFSLQPYFPHTYTLHLQKIQSASIKLQKRVFRSRSKEFRSFLPVSVSILFPGPSASFTQKPFRTCR